MFVFENVLCNPILSPFSLWLFIILIDCLSRDHNSRPIRMRSLRPSSTRVPEPSSPLQTLRTSSLAWCPSLVRVSEETPRWPPRCRGCSRPWLQEQEQEREQEQGQCQIQLRGLQHPQVGIARLKTNDLTFSGMEGMYSTDKFSTV